MARKKNADVPWWVWLLGAGAAVAVVAGGDDDAQSGSSTTYLREKIMAIVGAYSSWRDPSLLRFASDVGTDCQFDGFFGYFQTRLSGGGWAQIVSAYARRNPSSHYALVMQQWYAELVKAGKGDCAAANKIRNGQALHQAMRQAAQNDRTNMMLAQRDVFTEQVLNPAYEYCRKKGWVLPFSHMFVALLFSVIGKSITLSYIWQKAGKTGNEKKDLEVFIAWFGTSRKVYYSQMMADMRNVLLTNADLKKPVVVRHVDGRSQSINGQSGASPVSYTPPAEGGGLQPADWGGDGGNGGGWLGDPVGDIAQPVGWSGGSYNDDDGGGWIGNGDGYGGGYGGDNWIGNGGGYGQMTAGYPGSMGRYGSAFQAVPGSLGMGNPLVNCHQQGGDVVCDDQFAPYRYVWPKGGGAGPIIMDPAVSAQVMRTGGLSGAWSQEPPRVQEPLDCIRYPDGNLCFDHNQRAWLSHWYQCGQVPIWNCPSVHRPISHHRAHDIMHSGPGMVMGAHGGAMGHCGCPRCHP